MQLDDGDDGDDFPPRDGISPAATQHARELLSFSLLRLVVAANRNSAHRSGISEGDMP